VKCRENAECNKVFSALPCWRPFPDDEQCLMCDVSRIEEIVLCAKMDLNRIVEAELKLLNTLE